MRSSVVNDKRSFVVVFETGDEVGEGILTLAKELGLSGARFAGIGAFSRARLAFFDLAAKRYEEIAVDEQVEVGSLLGNVTRYEGEPRVHAHVVVAGRDGTARAGHLLEGRVHPTLELFVAETNSIDRSWDESIGLPLIDLS